MWVSSSVLADLFKKIDRLEAQVAKVNAQPQSLSTNNTSQHRG